MKRWLPAALLTLLALSGCDSGRERPSVAPIAPEQAEALYLQKCAICHGRDGDGRGPRRGSLHVKPPDFRLSAWRSGATFEHTRRVISEGIPGTDMPAWRTLSDAEVAGLADYVLGLSGRRTEAAE
jgi:mono/diheme cytochrome c family protein